MKARLVLVTVVLVALSPAFLAASHPLAALMIRGFFARVCHQNPARSFMFGGSPMAVCVRCLGIYCGAALAACVRAEFVSARRLMVGALLFNSLDVAAGAVHLYGNLPLLRFCLGLVLGVGLGAVVFVRAGEGA